MMLKKLFFLLYVPIIVACTETNHNNQENDCNHIDIACTEQFVMISLSVTDANNTPIRLDDYKVHRTDTGKEISSPNYGMDNYYPIIDDSFQSELANKELTLTFTGFIDNQQVINETYVVSADCCHIYLVSGKTTIIL